MKTPYDTLLRFREEQEAQSQLNVARGLLKHKAANERLSRLQAKANSGERGAGTAEQWQLADETHATSLRAIRAATLDLDSAQVELDTFRLAHLAVLRDRKIAEHLVQEAVNEKATAQKVAERRADDEVNASRYMRQSAHLSAHL